MVQEGTPLLPDGYYTLELTMLSTSVSLGLASRRMARRPRADDRSMKRSAMMANKQFELTGTWNALLTEQGTCYG